MIMPLAAGASCSRPGRLHHSSSSSRALLPGTFSCALHGPLGPLCATSLGACPGTPGLPDCAFICVRLPSRTTKKFFSTFWPDILALCLPGREESRKGG